MIKIKIILALILGVLCTPNLFAQYINKAIYFDTISGELPYSFFTQDNKLGVIGLMQDTTKNIYPIIYFDSLGYPTNLKKYKSKCPTVYPTSTNQLGQQNGQYYFLANCNPSFNKFEIYKILIDSLGDTVSTYRINNNDTSLALRTHFLPNGQMILLGQNPSEYFVQKWDGDSLLWTYQSDVNSPIILHNILMDGDDIVVSGRIGINNNSPGSDLYIAKLSVNGSILWDLVKDIGESELMGDLIIFNNKYLVSCSSGKWLSDKSDIFMGLISKDGNWESSKKIGTAARYRRAYKLAQNNRGVYFFGGEHNLEDNNIRGLIYLFDNDLNVKWSREYYYADNTKKTSIFWDARIEPDSTIKTIGVLYNGPGGQDLWYLHLDKHGCLTPGCEVNDVTVEEVNFDKLSEVEVYPNPTNTGSLSIKLSLKATQIKLEVFNNLGQSVYFNNAYQPGIEIELPKVQPGIYFISINYLLDGNLVTETQKLIVTND